jgi:hypothetical protein
LRFLPAVLFGFSPDISDLEKNSFSKIRIITNGSDYYWFGYYGKLEFDSSNRFVLAMKVDFEHRSPKPAEFFGFLITGKYTLVETYSRTTYLTSWMTVLVGDPLYNPYKNTPMVKESLIEPSPKSKSEK